MVGDLRRYRQLRLVLHLDFHPANVMLTSGGPVVIDWTNARAGPAGPMSRWLLHMAERQSD